MERAITADPLKVNELIGEIGKLQFKNKKYNDAIISYEKKKNGIPTNLSVAESFELGRAYYFGPKDYKFADTCFADVAQRSPNYAAAYLWRARSSFKLDPKNEKWLAKDYYVKYLELLTPEETTVATNKSSILEAARYLGDCFVNSKDLKDNTKAKFYWEMVKKFEPTDKQAAAFLASPAGK